MPRIVIPGDAPPGDVGERQTIYAECVQYYVCCGRKAETVSSPSLLVCLADLVFIPDVVAPPAEH